MATESTSLYLCISVQSLRYRYRFGKLGQENHYRSYASKLDFDLVYTSKDWGLTRYTVSVPREMCCAARAN